LPCASGIISLHNCQRHLPSPQGLLEKGVGIFQSSPTPHAPIRTNSKCEGHSLNAQQKMQCRILLSCQVTGRYLSPHLAPHPALSKKALASSLPHLQPMPRSYQSRKRSLGRRNISFGEPAETASIEIDSVRLRGAIVFGKHASATTYDDSDSVPDHWRPTQVSDQP